MQRLHDNLRVLLLTKRRSTGQDILIERCGRIYELSSELANLGHEVIGVCFSYHPNVRRPVTDGEPVKWYAHGVGVTGLGIVHYLFDLDRIVRRHRPDLVLGASDALHLLVAAWLSRRHHLPCAVDLYDNFESFRLTSFPFLRRGLASAVRYACAVSVVSDELADLVRSRYERAGGLTVIENAVPDGTFRPVDKEKARSEFGLPLTARIVGTAGALDANRGIRSLYASFLSLAETDAHIHLALAGRPDRAAPIPEHSRVHYVGKLPYERVPMFLSCLDVGVISNQSDSFGQYCFPQKLYEMVACGLPIVAPNIGVTKRVLKGYPRSLYQPNDTASLIRTLRDQITHQEAPAINVPTWKGQARRLEASLREAVS